ncbi:hypothetical protein G6F68_018830 [Rhizopus microsporus]|nr:hypothetical protein G6F68_018830 [Rhizopus microsporus]
MISRYSLKLRFAPIKRRMWDRIWIGRPLINSQVRLRRPMEPLSKAERMAMQVLKLLSIRQRLATRIQCFRTVARFLTSSMVRIESVTQAVTWFECSIEALTLAAMCVPSSTSGFPQFLSRHSTGLIRLYR